MPERAIHALCVFFGGNLHEICVESAFFQVGERGILPGGSRSWRTHTRERERARRTERTQPCSAEENVILLGSPLYEVPGQVKSSVRVYSWGRSRAITVCLCEIVGIPEPWRPLEIVIVNVCTRRSSRSRVVVNSGCVCVSVYVLDESSSCRA